MGNAPRIQHFENEALEQPRFGTKNKFLIQERRPPSPRGVRFSNLFSPFYLRTVSNTVQIVCLYLEMRCHATATLHPKSPTLRHVENVGWSYSTASDPKHNFLSLFHSSFDRIAHKMYIEYTISLFVRMKHPVRVTLVCKWLRDMVSSSVRRMKIGGI